MSSGMRFVGGKTSGAGISTHDVLTSVTCICRLVQATFDLVRRETSRHLLPSSEWSLHRRITLVCKERKNVELTEKVRPCNFKAKVICEVYPSYAKYGQVAYCLITQTRSELNNLLNIACSLTVGYITRLAGRVEHVMCTWKGKPKFRNVIEP